ncbi:hypothetical protein BTHE_2015 [Bifidobacterium thermophilum]|nr:hypothetical protein BTHE_2015 [Bifidobacterium thermophilum]
MLSACSRHPSVSCNGFISINPEVPPVLAGIVRQLVHRFGFLRFVVGIAVRLQPCAQPIMPGGTC